MGINLNTPLVKALIIGGLLFSVGVAVIKVPEAQSATMTYTEAAQPLLAGRSDQELNVIGDSVCAMYKGGSTTEEVVTYMVNHGASPDAADQLARVIRVYKCPQTVASKN